MLKLWKNPMLPIEERVAVADGEIERLRSLLNNAETLYKQRDAENERLRERLSATLEIALEIQDNPAGSQFDIGYVVDQCAVALNPDSITVPNARTHLPPERPKAAEETLTAPAVKAVRCSEMLGAAYGPVCVIAIVLTAHKITAPDNVSK